MIIYGRFPSDEFHRPQIGTTLFRTCPHAGRVSRGAGPHTHVTIGLDGVRAPGQRPRNELDCARWRNAAIAGYIHHASPERGVDSDPGLV